MTKIKIFKNLIYIFFSKKIKCFSDTKMKKIEKLSVFPVQNGEIKCFSGTKLAKLSVFAVKKPKNRGFLRKKSRKVVLSLQ